MRLTAAEIKQLKKKRKIVSLTAYDYSFAVLMDQAGVDIILVGDSLGMVACGYASTTTVTLREMIHHTKAVSRGCQHSFVLADIPFGSLDAGSDRCLRASYRLIKEGGADGVKIEGGEGAALEAVKRNILSGVPTVGHLGLLPQSVSALGGYKTQGKDHAQAKQILDQAMALEDAGVFAIVLECVTEELACKISESVSIPTIGIGSGPGCDGQVLVSYDMLGLTPGKTPNFVKKYEDFSSRVTLAIKHFSEEVCAGEFPIPKKKTL